MNNQITISTSSGNVSAFLQSGFYFNRTLSPTLHKHNYAEVHIVHGANATYHIGNREYHTSDGNLIIIPGGMYHACLNAEEGCRHSAFQVNLDINEFFHVKISEETIEAFFKEIEKCIETPNYTVISAYINLFCSFFDAKTEKAIPIADYGFLIHEFFTVNYNRDIQLCDLAECLHVSQRQTERLVMKHTGNSFREELCQVRITMAKELLKTTDMSLSEVSSYVGYRSYAGFWKAMKKYS